MVRKIERRTTGALNIQFILRFRVESKLTSMKFEGIRFQGIFYWIEFNNIAIDFQLRIYSIILLSISLFDTFDQFINFCILQPRVDVDTVANKRRSERHWFFFLYFHIVSTFFCKLLFFSLYSHPFFRNPRAGNFV